MHLISVEAVENTGPYRPMTISAAIYRVVAELTVGSSCRIEGCIDPTGRDVDIATLRATLNKVSAAAGMKTATRKSKEGGLVVFRTE